MKEKHRKTYSVAEKAALLEKYKASGSSIKEWCKENQIGLSTLQRWLKQEQFCAESLVQTWVPVKTVVPASTVSLSIQAGAFSIPISEQTNIQLLANVLKVIATIC